MTLMTRYRTKALNQVVLSGAHDAGIYTEGLKSNVQTQYLDIGEQARHGCRFFDMRIAFQKIKSTGGTQYVSKAYHADKSLVTDKKVKREHQLSLGGRVSTHQKLKLDGGTFGDWGDTLYRMLDQARAFVADPANADEFLILKFAKCSNWAEVAKSCVDRLQGNHYSLGGNLNTTPISSLGGSVITIFPDDAEVRGQMPNNPGIMYYRELYDPLTRRSTGYEATFPGFQYFGKFSSTEKISDNAQQQKTLMLTGAATDPNAIGMMYWTTTGSLGNIRQRNAKMWEGPNVRSLKETWHSGLKASIDNHAGDELRLITALGGGAVGSFAGRLKLFMPNIVMMDFVDSSKCDIIDGLNDVTPNELQQLYMG